MAVLDKESRFIWLATPAVQEAGVGAAGWVQQCGHSRGTGSTSQTLAGQTPRVNLVKEVVRGDGCGREVAGGVADQCKITLNFVKLGDGCEDICEDETFVAVRGEVKLCDGGCGVTMQADPVSSKPSFACRVEEVRELRFP